MLARCQHREALAAAACECGEDASHTCGVRALLSGPSGTGKTLAARILAAALGKDLYRVDVSATVNKYLGETEKNLDRAFSAAEELDIILLLDEGDALMATRTDVGSSNDRYANLETNFLLQRIELFAGILLVTTNAADRIDKAFARRMDVIILFRAPDEHAPLRDPPPASRRPRDRRPVAAGNGVPLRADRRPDTQRHRTPSWWHCRRAARSAMDQRMPRCSASTARPARIARSNRLAPAPTGRADPMAAPVAKVQGASADQKVVAPPTPVTTRRPTTTVFRNPRLPDVDHHLGVNPFAARLPAVKAQKDKYLQATERRRRTKNTRS